MALSKRSSMPHTWISESSVNDTSSVDSESSDSEYWPNCPIARLHDEQINNEYSRFESRWKSFPYWVDAIQSCCMAQAGFYHDEQRGCVECFKCRASLSSWKHTTYLHCRSLASHHKIYCGFVNKNEMMSGAVNITSQTWDGSSRRCDVCDQRSRLVSFLCGHQYACRNCASFHNHCHICNKEAIIL